MAWIRYGNCIRLDGAAHYDKKRINSLIETLDAQERGHPETLCSQLRGVIADGIVSKDLIFRLSKWCDWDDESRYTATAIAKALFYGNVCPRLYVSHGNTSQRLPNANELYQQWMEAVLNAPENRRET
jgi:hypothetical protein